MRAIFVFFSFAVIGGCGPIDPLPIPDAAPDDLTYYDAAERPDLKRNPAEYTPAAPNVGTCVPLVDIDGSLCGCEDRWCCKRLDNHCLPYPNPVGEPPTLFCNSRGWCELISHID